MIGRGESANVHQNYHMMQEIYVWHVILQDFGIKLPKFVTVVNPISISQAN
jgi:hypothetical protein